MGDRSHYALVCAGCDHRQSDDGLALTCPNSHPPALLRTAYDHGGFSVDPVAEGIGRYARWLPVARPPRGRGRPVVYPGERLGRHLGLTDLWIAFNGYWPEKNAFVSAATFKEYESATVGARLPESFGTLVVASAGNTAAAFAQADVPVVLIIPESGLAALAGADRPGPSVRVVVLTGGDYSDCIRVAGQLAARDGFYGEGGILNVARRDGLGTVLLAAYETMGFLPGHYVQAVGSGTGAVAVHEAATRLVAAGAGQAVPRLLLAQNADFAPLHKKWLTGTDQAGKPSQSIFAPELTNRHPPFDITGGVRDCLRDSDGDVLTADAASAARAREDFHRIEGIDVEPAAAVALAVLQRAVRTGRVRRTDTVLLNVTGGGRARRATEFGGRPVVPHLVINQQAADPDRLADRLRRGYDHAVQSVPSSTAR
ncbi:cysteate synthase [Actinoplanes sp. NPDC051861]|uniref:cysteate synthase n=1 Tax=Actinoplanes sp. NPDC051861 TaxID=3155170 RepID=UPI0034173664